jgi:type VI secretion system secreted protein VgrG
MPTFSQANRALQVTTPLGDDTLVATGFRGSEQISHLFSFELDLLADNSTTVDFNQLIGKQFTLKVATPGQGSDPEWRYVDGICVSFSEGDRDQQFTYYSAELVPRVWLLTRLSRSRIFQQKSVPDILKKLFEGFDCDFQLRSQYEAREYCVQYRESDFNFASRLMEDEGIYYFFKHSEKAHKMVVADTPQSHVDVPGLTTARYEMVEGGPRKADHVYQWRKTQAVRASKYTLWDHSFQQPTQNLEARDNILDSVQAGTVTHHLKDQANAPLEIYDFPGGYAERFDGISPSGGEQPARLQKLFEDNKRTVKLRMESEALPALTIRATSSCSNFTSGHKFNLDRHFDANGEYVLISVTHNASIASSYRSGNSGQGISYSNSFTCVPVQLPFRPDRRTPVPFIAGAQSALVTGPAGKEVFTDKYGRVKVQFFWDREGKNDENSSCWIRVAQSFSGKRWGSSFWPRLGQEVLVAFMEGDPDQPVIVGSVYNAEQMPPYLGDGLDSKHKNDPNVSGIKTNSTLGGTGFNEIRFDDAKDKEELFLHAQRNLDVTTNGDSLASTGGDRHQIIGGEKDGKKTGDQKEMVYRDKHLKIHRNQIEQIGDSMQLLVGGIDAGQGNQDIVIKGIKKESIAKDYSLNVTGGRKENIGGGQSLTVGGDQQQKIGQHHLVDAGQEIHLKAGMKIIIEAGMQISLKGPGGFVDIGPAGVTIQGTMVLINSGGSAGSGTDCNPAGPDAPTEANPTEPTVADDSKSGQKSARA